MAIRSGILETLLRVVVVLATAVWAATQVILSKLLLATPKAALAGAVAMGVTVMQLHGVAYPKAAMVREGAQAATAATLQADVGVLVAMVMAASVATPARYGVEVALPVMAAVVGVEMAAMEPPEPVPAMVAKAGAATVATAHPAAAV